MRKREYDFLTWKSFPSSAKLVNDEGPGSYAYWGTYTPETLAVRPGSKLRIEAFVKQQNVIYGNYPTFMEVSVRGFDGSKWKWIGRLTIPLGTFDWTNLSDKMAIPSDIIAIRWMPVGGAGEAGKPGVTWFDDLKIFQDDMLIYSDDFSKWDPMIGVGIGAPIGGVTGYLLKEPLGPMVSEAVGAVVGGALGGGVGLLTGLGIIPVPQIPSLEAAPEGPGAPMRLGKYLITG